MAAIFDFYNKLIDNIQEWFNINSPILAHTWIICCFLFVINIFLYMCSSFKRTRCVDGQFQNEKYGRLLQALEDRNVIEVIGILNACPDLVNKPIKANGYTPFMIVCAQSNTQLVKYMLNMGADINKKTPQNESVFYLAIFYFIINPCEKNATCIRELFYAGCDVNEPNSKGYTPLQMAAMFGHTPLVKWLLNKKAKIAVHPHPGVIASSQGHQEAAGVICEWEKDKRKAIDSCES